MLAMRYVSRWSGLEGSDSYELSQPCVSWPSAPVTSSSNVWQGVPQRPCQIKTSASFDLTGAGLLPPSDGNKEKRNNEMILENDFILKVRLRLRCYRLNVSANFAQGMWVIGVGRQPLFKNRPSTISVLDEWSFTSGGQIRPGSRIYLHIKPFSWGLKRMKKLKKKMKKTFST